MRLPKIGEILLTDNGRYRPSPALVTDYGPGENEDGGVPVVVTLFNPGGSPQDFNGRVYLSQELAKEGNLRAGELGLWYQDDPRQQLINDLIVALASYQSTL